MPDNPLFVKNYKVVLFQVIGLQSFYDETKIIKKGTKLEPFDGAS